MGQAAVSNVRLLRPTDGALPPTLAGPMDTRDLRELERQRLALAITQLREHVVALPPESSVRKFFEDTLIGLHRLARLRGRRRGESGR
jgi:hypothetical protein